MNTELQRLSAWCGLAAMIIFFLGLITMGFFPALPPSLTPEQVAAIYQEHAVAIRLGALLLVISAMFCGPFSAVIYMQLRRMEGSQRPVCSVGQLASGIANIQFFILPGIFFVIASYRPDRPLEVTYALNDIAWVVTMLPWTVGAMQCLCIAAAVLKHGTESTPYPRWVGFFNIWIAVGMTTSSVIPFFKTGPFAWNGLVGFWIPATVFGLWEATMAIMTLRAVKREESVGQAASATTGTWTPAPQRT
jgi:hypothetical protein